MAKYTKFKRLGIQFHYLDLVLVPFKAMRNI